jgi:hypothetical protein
MFAQLKQQDLKNATKPVTTGGGGGTGVGDDGYSAAAEAAQNEIKGLALSQLKQMTDATLLSMKVSQTSQLTSLFMGMMSEAQSQLIKAAQTYLQLAGQAHALMNAGVQ